MRALTEDWKVTNRLTAILIALCLPGFTALVSAQDVTEDCELGERYYALAQKSLAEFNEQDAAGWLVRASSVCSRFEYFMALGELWMDSLLASEKASAVDVFIRAYDIAETDVQRATALHRYADLLAREKDPANALELIIRARQLDPENPELGELEASIRSQLGHSQSGPDRAGDETLYRPLTAGGEQQSSTLEPYPWPPEEASWQVRIDRIANPPFDPGMSLVDVEHRLSQALRASSYATSSLYSAPNGFVMVTRLEAMDGEGRPLEGSERYRLPEDENVFSMTQYIRSLFFAPEGRYRFIAFVVSDQFSRTREAELSERVALKRLRRGALRLPPEYNDLRFTENHQIVALIYEFRKGGEEGDIETLLPGRISAEQHLENSGLSTALLK